MCIYISYTNIHIYILHCGNAYRTRVSDMHIGHAYRVFISVMQFEELSLSEILIRPSNVHVRFQRLICMSNLHIRSGGPICTCDIRIRYACLIFISDVHIGYNSPLKQPGFPRERALLRTPKIGLIFCWFSYFPCHFAFSIYRVSLYRKQCMQGRTGQGAGQWTVDSGQDRTARDRQDGTG